MVSLFPQPSHEERPTKDPDKHSDILATDAIDEPESLDQIEIIEKEFTCTIDDVRNFSFVAIGLHKNFRVIRPAIQPVL